MAKPKINPLKNIRYKKSNPVIPFTQGNDMRGFFESWINSPEYKNRLNKNRYENPDTIQSNRLSAVNNMDISYDDNLTNMSNSPSTPSSRGFVNINKQEVNELGDSVNSVTAHEMSHVMGARKGAVNRNVGFNNVERDLLKDSIIKNRPDSNGQEFHNWRHLNNPEEIKADLDASRYNLFNKGVYDIRQGTPFTREHLDKSKQILNNDGTFNRLIDQVGDDNFIELMNSIASNKQENMTMAKFGGKINPVQQQYFLGGALGQGFTPGSASSATGMGLGMLSGLIPQQDKQGLTSVGGSTASGAIQGASSLAMLGPWGMAGGAVLGGGMALINSQKQREQEQRDIQLEKDNKNRHLLANMNYGVGQSSNLPMANGGSVNPMSSNPVGSFTSFEGGGTHESNPNGGIPQGMNSNGQQMTVEEGESAFKFKDSKYIFSNRLKY